MDFVYASRLDCNQCPGGFHLTMWAVSVQEYIKFKRTQTQREEGPPWVMDSDPVPAVVLAAGFSRRLGRPKALVSINGRTLIEWAHERLIAAGCHPVVVVNASIESQVRARLPTAHLVVNADPDSGRTGSLQLGIHALSQTVERPLLRLVMVPVDRPCWNVEVVKTLLGHGGNAAASNEGRNGHPVVMMADALASVNAAKQDTPLRDIVDFVGVPVHAPWLHMNIDTPDDVDRLMAQGNHLAACFSQSEGI